MKYDEKDLRAIDIFSLVLVGVGILLAALGAMTPELAPAKKADGKIVAIEKNVALTETEAESAVVAKPKMEMVSPVSPSAIILGVVFLCLGAALNMQLRKVIANKGEDLPTAYVPAE